MTKNPRAQKFRFQEEHLLSGEGELHGLLKAVGLTKADFCKLAEIDPSVFDRWYGFPLHRWPEILLLYYGWTQNMAKVLHARGFDPEYFKPKLPARVKAGRYARTEEDATRMRAEFEERFSLVPRFQPPKRG